MKITDKPIEQKILDLYGRRNVYKHFWCRDIAIDKVKSYIEALGQSGLQLPRDLKLMFNYVTVAHIKEKASMSSYEICRNMKKI